MPPWVVNAIEAIEAKALQAGAKRSVVATPAAAAA